MSSTKILKILLCGLIIILILELISVFHLEKLFKPRPGSCKILEQQYCSKAQRITLDVNGVKVEYLAFNLPPGAPIFTLYDGLLVKAQESGNLSGIYSQVRTDFGAAIFRGDIKFDDMIQKDVKAGNIIGYVGNTGAKLGKYSDFNIGFILTRTGPVLDVTKEKELFPKAFEKP